MLLFPCLLMLMSQDAKIVDLKDGFVRVQTAAYTVEVPKGWAVSSETPWGARDIKPAEGKGQMGTMTAGPTTASWDQLVKTSLGFILREKPGKPTPFKIGKAKQGYESCVFTVVGDNGFADRRYTLLRAPNNKVLALSVKIPDKKSEAEYVKAFDRMIATARIAD